MALKWLSVSHVPISLGRPSSHVRHRARPLWAQVRTAWHGTDWRTRLRHASSKSYGTILASRQLIDSEVLQWVPTTTFCHTQIGTEYCMISCSRNQADYFRYIGYNWLFSYMFVVPNLHIHLSNHSIYTSCFTHQMRVPDHNLTINMPANAPVFNGARLLVGTMLLIEISSIFVSGMFDFWLKMSYYSGQMMMTMQDKRAWSFGRQDLNCMCYVKV